jgi:hypothetical protein
VSLVASVLPGQGWDYYVSELPLAIGLQLRNAALHAQGSDIVPPGRSAEAKGREILGDHIKDWTG